MCAVTLTDLSLSEYGLTPRVKDLREAYFRALPEICIERPKLVTEFSLQNDLFKRSRISILDKARLYRFVLERRTPVIRHKEAREKGMVPFTFDDRSLFAGSTTSKFKGVPLYPEFMALALWPELGTISTRERNPYYLSPQDAEELNFNVFPYWMEGNILELARKRCGDGTMEASALKLLERLVFFLASKPNCISHTIPDFSRAINLGLRRMIQEAQDKESKTADPTQKEFYRAIAEVLEGVIDYSKKLAAEAERLAQQEKDPQRHQELKDLAAIHSWVPENPARTFREGLTTLWICWIAIHLENPNVGLSLGRLDQVLYPLYRQDIDSKKLTLEAAIELLCCLWLKIGDHVPTIPDAGEQLFGGTGSNQAITIGGVDKAGNSAVNDLTYVMLRATELMKLRDPNLNARYHPEVNSEEYLKQLCRVNISTGATPALHNDRAVIRALTAKGETPEQARDYGVIGCVEPGSNGRFYGHSASILLNLTSALELTLYNGRHRHTGMDQKISIETGDPRQFQSINEFKQAFEKQCRWLAEQTTALNNLLGKVHQDFYPTPILSAFFEGPMDKGKDLIQGGAVINSSGVTIIGLADVADSLSANQALVFVDRCITMAELLNAMEKDFEGEKYKRWGVQLMNPKLTPKYGNENPLADGNVSWIIQMLDEVFGSIANYRGGKYRVGYWTMTNHAGYGRLTKALPSGRKAGENFTSGITPVSGVTPALTPALNSVAKQPVECIASGMALNLKYTPETAGGEKMLDDFMASVRAYFDPPGNGVGGMEIQFNVTDHKTFVKAMKNPKAYKELLVRVSGYTAYFKDLNPQMQKEITDRTEYLLSTGKAVPYAPISLPSKKTWLDRLKELINFFS